MGAQEWPTIANNFHDVDRNLHDFFLYLVQTIFIIILVVETKRFLYYLHCYGPACYMHSLLKYYFASAKL